MKRVPRSTAPHHTPVDGTVSSIPRLQEAERAAEDTIAKAGALALQKIANARAEATDERRQALERSRDVISDECAKAAKESEMQVCSIAAETERKIIELRRRAERHREHVVRMLVAEVVP